MRSLETRLSRLEEAAGPGRLIVFPVRHGREDEDAALWFAGERITPTSADTVVRIIRFCGLESATPDLGAIR